MFKHIGAETRALVDRAKARTQSTERWWIDRGGTLHISMDSVNRRPFSLAESEAIRDAVLDFANTSREVH